MLERNNLITRRDFLKMAGGFVFSGKLLDLIASQDETAATPTATPTTRPTIIPIEQQLEATAWAVQHKGETSSFAPEGPFTKVLFKKYIEPNIFFTSLQPNPEINQLYNMTSWLVKIPGDNYSYLCTSTHELLKQIPPEIELRNAIGGKLQSLTVTPLAAVVDISREQTLFRIKKQAVADGFDYEDEANLVKSSPITFGFFGFPQEFKNLAGGAPILQGDVATKKWVTPSLRPEMAYLPPMLSHPGSSGSVILMVDSKTGEPKAVGISLNRQDYLNREGGVVETQPYVAPLRINAMLAQMPEEGIKEFSLRPETS